MRSLTGVVVGAFVLSTVAGCASQLDRGVAEFQRGNYDKAASLWTPLAKTGDPVAQRNVGILWERGLGSTPLNLTEAAAWYSLSAQGGHTPAMVSLARIERRYAYEDEALSWLTLAAQSGDQEAINDLRTWGKPVPQPDLYQTGSGTEQPKRLQHADATAASLTPEVGVDAANSSVAGVAPPPYIGWSAALAASGRSLGYIAPNARAEARPESGDASAVVEEQDLSRSTDQDPDETGVEEQTRDDSMTFPRATAIAEWIIGLAGFGNSEAMR